MDSSDQAGSLSNLPDVLLILIISYLHFNDCVKTIVSRRWTSLYRETRKVAFKEFDFVKPSFDRERKIDARMAFIDSACEWIATLRDQPVDSFEICISYPTVYLDDIQDLVHFACQKGVKNLVLDFSHPTWSWRTIREVQAQWREAFVFEVPVFVKILTTLESLKVCSCKSFDPWTFWFPETLKIVSFGWMGLPNLGPFLSKASRLESLSINDCWGIDSMKITSNVREIVFENSYFLHNCCTFNLPRVDVFKYTGGISYLRFKKMNKVIKEVHLDFRVRVGDSEDLKEPTFEQARAITDILTGLHAARTLTVSSYLLKVIKIYKNFNHVIFPMETQHLVLKTTLHPKYFIGIRVLLRNFPDLKTLTFDLLPSKSVMTTSSYDGIDPRTYWMENITSNCLRKTLKAVVVNNFVGGLNELNVLRCLIRSGSEHEPVLERIELYVPSVLEEHQKTFALMRSEMLQRSSEHVQVSCGQFMIR